MSKQITLSNINGSSFHAEVSEPNEISVLEGGYIITPNGYFIPVKDNEDHADKFTSYLVQYLEDFKYHNLNSIEAAKVLSSLGHIVYFGLKMKDNQNIFCEKNGMTDGYAVVLLPSNLDMVTIAQKSSIISLLNTNKSIFGNHPILELQCTNFTSEENITEEDLRNFCKHHQEKIKVR